MSTTTTTAKGQAAGLQAATVTKGAVTSWIGQPSPEASHLMNKAVELALYEDLGRRDGEDITSEATIAPAKFVSASVIYKQVGVVAGLNAFEAVFNKVDNGVTIKLLKPEGSVIDTQPVTVAVVEGPAKSILKAERTALNFLQRLSGIATITKQFVDIAKPHGIAILDTRKTTPGLRAYEKYAASVGGAVNHRFGLYDGVLIKDNHIRLCGGINKAIKVAKQKYPNQPIEAEAATLEEVRAALSEGVAVIMLDNMTPDMVKKAVKLIDGQCRIEVSGGINLKTIKDYLIEGVTAISVGALTHSALSIDISLEVGD
jgi:nicotinate-nucleotide pyrophosphorylase (carboxylating)